MNNIIYTAVILIGLMSCELKDKEFSPSSGEADFSKTVIIGDSYLAGYMDNALYAEGQESGVGSTLSSQLMHVGNTLNQMPLIEADKSIGAMQNGKYELQIVNGSIAPVPTAGDITLLSDPSKWINVDAPFANVSVPGAKSFHLVSPLFGDYNLGEGNFNPFYTRFASAPGTSTVIGDALLNEATFFVYWAGIYDVLDYATKGGVGSSAGISAGDITPIEYFTQATQLSLASLSASGAKGVVANIPDICQMPFFTAIPYNALELSTSQSEGLNNYFSDYNLAATANGLPTMDFLEGANAFVIEDESYPLLVRQITDKEQVLLTAQTEIASWPEGQVLPLTDAVVLSNSEIEAIMDATAAFNNVLESEASEFAFVDMKKWLDTIHSNSLVIDGNAYSTGFITGNLFSLDGLHPSMQGSSLMANEFIKAINLKYDANIPNADVNNKPGIVLP